MISSTCCIWCAHVSSHTPSTKSQVVCNISLGIYSAMCVLQVTDAQLQVSAVPGSRYKFRPSQLAGAGTAASPGHAHHASWPTPALGSSTPGLTTNAYSSGMAGARMPTPGTAGVTAASKASAAAKAPHPAFSMAAFSPQTVTPRQDYKMPAAAASTVGRH